MQDCPDGRLTQDKFVKTHELFFPGVFCQNFFKTFDTSQKGYLTFREYLLAINMTNAGTPEDKLKEAFRMFDLDGNGEISLDEMTKIVENIFKLQQVSATTINAITRMSKKIFLQMDLKEDGILTEEEFVSSCLQDDLLMHNMLLHRHYLDNGGDHHFRSVWSKSNLKKRILKNLRR